jgi:branched-chain amino acid transport system substrate-binding protein
VKGSVSKVSVLLAAVALSLVASCGAPAAQPSAPAQPTAAPPTAAPSQPTASQQSGAPAQATSAPAAAKPATGKPIKVGYVGSLTGVGADVGNANLGGAKLAVEDVNGAGGISGRPIELVIYDDQTDPATSVTRVEKLITQDEVEAVIGGTHSATTMANRMVSEKYGIVQLTPQAQNVEATQGVKWLFRGNAVDVDNADAIVDLAYAMGFKKPSIQASTSAFGVSGGKGLEAAAERKGIKAVDVESHKEAGTDLTAQVLAAKNAGADLLLTWAQGVDVALFAKTKKQLGFDIPLYGIDAAMHKAAPPIAGDAYEGVMAVTYVDIDRPEVNNLLFNRFVKATGSEPTTWSSAALGYDAVMLISQGLKPVVNGDGKIDQAKFKAAMESINKYQGMTGAKGSSWTFTADNHNGLTRGAQVFYQWKGGKWVRMMSWNELLANPSLVNAWKK